MEDRVKVWHLFGRTFTITESDKGDTEVLGKRYSVHLWDGRKWDETKDDLAFVVLTSYLDRVGRKGEAILEDKSSTPSFVLECVHAVSGRFGKGGDSLSRSFAVCYESAQERGLVRSGTRELTEKGDELEKKNQEGSGSAKRSKEWKGLLKSAGER
jgi:hypothetical protein